MSDSLRPHGLYSPWNSLGQNTEVGSLSLLQKNLPDPGMNPGLPHCRWILYQLSQKGSPRTLEYVANPFSRGSSQPRDRTRSPALRADSLPAEPQGKPKSAGEGSLSIFQWMFPTQELNRGLLHCRWIQFKKRNAVALLLILPAELPGKPQA